MSFFGINFGVGGGAEIDIILDDADTRKMADVKDENGRKERFYLFYDGESVTGKVNITLHRKTSKLEHQGIRIDLIGHIELYYDRGNHHEFLSLTKELAGPGEITQNKTFDFEFNQVEKPFETYTGVNVRLRYFLRVTMGRRLTDQTKELTLAVHTLATYPDMNNPIKMEVGIEECLHIEFEYNKSKYHLKDVIVGKIYFLLVRIKIKHMEIAIIKREATGAGPNTYNESENIAKYEIMDGAPVRGESIPIRVFLAGYDLTPTFRDVIKKFSVRYYLNLVLVDEEDRRYFKQQEIVLWRKGERVRKLPLSTSLYQQQQHALARHQAGDMPTEGVRTAPTPSLPPTPSIGESESRLPGDVSQTAGQSQMSVDTAQEGEGMTSYSADDHEFEAEVEPKQMQAEQTDTQQTNLQQQPNTHTAPPDLVSGTQDLNIKDDSVDSDSKKDLVGNGKSATPAVEPMVSELRSADSAAIVADRDSDGNTSGGDTRPFSPPDITDDLEDGDGDLVAGDGDVIDLDLPDAPTSEPGSPKAKEEKKSAASAVGQLAAESV